MSHPVEDDDDPFAVFSPSPSAGAMPSASIMHVVGAPKPETAPPPRPACVRESFSGIRVSHPTRACEQLPLVAAQHPFRTFAEARRLLTSADPPPAVTLVGVVARRSAPKRAANGAAFGVVGLWNMRGPFPAPADELAVLVGGDALAAHFARLAVGAVVAVSAPRPMSGRPDAMLCASAAAQWRLLGRAADIATCAAPGGQCGGLVRAPTRFCGRHVALLRREAAHTPPALALRGATTPALALRGTTPPDLALRGTGGGPYAGVERGASLRVGAPTPPVAADALLFGVTSRGRAALEAVCAAHAAETGRQRLRRALAAEKRPRDGGDEVAAVRSAFAPLSSRTAPAGGGAKVRPLRDAAAQLAKALPRPPAESESGASSAIGRLAERMHSAHDGLRAEDAQRRFEARTERRLAQEQAIHALEAVTEQSVRAVFCRQCDRFYTKRNELCRREGHTVEQKETVRRFIECEHCGYRTFVLGDTRASRVIPRCPRCCADCVWRQSNAAPESVTPKEISSKQ